MRRADHIRFTGSYQSRDEAAASLQTTGDAALVQRGVPRMLLLKCPCGCGDVLIVNLDKRSGPAWRMYRRRNAVSLYPSYWRDSKCGSHFIIWSNHIYWCDWDDDSIWSNPSDIEDRVLTALTDRFVNYDEIADQLHEVPWDILQACYSLVRKGRAINNQPKRKGEFKRSNAEISN